MKFSLKIIELGVVLFFLDFGFRVFGSIVEGLGLE